MDKLPPSIKNSVYNYQLNRRCIGEMFDNPIEKSQRVPKFRFCHLASGGSIQRLVEFNKTLLDMSKNGSEHFSNYCPVRITTAKLNSTGNDRISTHYSQLIVTIM